MPERSNLHSRTVWLARGLAVLALASAASAWTPPKTYPPTNEIVVDNRVAIPMRDGVILYADIYRPAKEGKYPVIVSRTPYSTERAPSSHVTPTYFARRGYVFVYQDIRGRHESEGRWEPFRDDIEDGYDTIEWAAASPWSNGDVCMYGGSALAMASLYATGAAPPSLRCVFALVGTGDP
ncbi:MAG: CocE/NonD family hydrolase, partial [Acidobacteria bacterium]|nr:CocE/NonD family hydrolase [Acidobacteriota bacterium]